MLFLCLFLLFTRWWQIFCFCIFINSEFFYFLFLGSGLWFVDCFVVSLFAMTKGQRVVFTNSSLREFVELVAISLFLACHCENRRFVAISVWQPPHLAHTVIARTEGSWQSRYGNHYTQPALSLRGLKKSMAISLFLACHCENRRFVAISLWQPLHPTRTVIARTEGSWQSRYGNHHS